MKKLLFLILIAFAFINNSFAQDPWSRIHQNKIDNNSNNIRCMAVFKDSLYVSIGSGEAYSGEGDNPSFLKTGNGVSGDANWIEAMPTLSYSNGQAKSIEAMTTTTKGPGYFYIAAVEDSANYDSNGMPTVYRSVDGRSWTKINYIGMGNEERGAYAIIEFNDYLYISTTDVSSGTQARVYRTPYDVTGPNNWTLCNVPSGLGKLTKFVQLADTLYSITDLGFLHKTVDGANWSLVSSISQGFGNINNSSYTAAVVHNDTLFIGTENYIDGPQLWKSGDGINFIQVTAPSLIAKTNPALFSQKISDLNSSAGNLVVSIKTDSGQGFYGKVLRTSDGYNFNTSTDDGFGNTTELQSAISIEYKNEFYMASENISGPEDINLQKVNFTPCSGAPDAGYVTGDLSVCSTTGGSTELSLVGATSGLGLTYQWQQSIDAGTTWNTITTGIGYDGVNYTTEIITYTTQYRALVTCTNSSSFSYSNPVQVNLSVLDCYCQSYASNDEDSKIDSVGFNTIHNSFAADCPVYTDYSNIKTNIYPDSTYTFALKTGSCGSDYPRHAKLFIDYNIDGDFDDLGEDIGFIGPTTGGIVSEVLTYSVTIPSTTSFGETKMRVVLAESSSETEILPCGTYGYGETEDYHVYMVQPILLNSVGTGNYCEGNTFVASYTTDNYLSGNEFKLQLSDNLGSFANPFVIGTTISTATGTVNATLPLTMTAGNYSVRVIATNPANISDAQTITILPDPNIDGAVLSNSVLVAGGKVSLYKYNPIYRMDVEQEVNINADGTYTFTTIPLGDYIIQAKPSVSNNPGAYFGDVQLWQDATLLSLTCGVNQTNKNVNTNPYPALTGQGTISGGVYRGVNYGSGKTDALGDPIPGVDVSLEQNPGGIIIAVTPTSTVTGEPLGTYIFSNVVSGSYDVKVDLPGIGMSSIHTATISGDQDTTHLDYYVDSNSVYIVPSTVSIAEKMQVMQQTKVYPNPSVDYILVETANNNQPAEISLYNTFGQLVYIEKTTNNKTKINVDDRFKQGVYVVKITQGNINSQHRIVISK
ncbi:MAG: GEVED domain-containing protein [Bacteroidota bacterium]